MPKLIDDSLFHKTLNGFELLRRREKAGLSQEEFAEKCDWSQQYQNQLEAPGLHEINIETAQKIVKTIDSCGGKSQN